MAVFTRENIKQLMGHGDKLCISIYLPTGTTGAEGKQGQIRLKNLLRQAQDQMIENGYKKQDIEGLTEPIQTLISDTLFWSYQRGGLAIFLAENVFEYYQVPYEFEELAIIAQNFHLKPLMPLFVEDGTFYVLALNQKHVKLLACSRFLHYEIPLEDVPTSLEEYLKYDDPERQLQFSSFNPAGGVGRSVASYHGHSLSDEEKTNLLRFFQEIEKGVRKTLQDSRSPLILAGVEYYLPMYREANQYSTVIEPGIVGSVEAFSNDELHEKAWEIVESYFQQAREEALSKYQEIVGTGRTSTDIKEIVLGAYTGRIATMFVASGKQQWGRFDKDTSEVILEDQSTIENQDLLNDAAIQTFLNNGTVYVVSEKLVPDNKEVAAMFRF
ncbi:hypothetical protein BHU72_04265 [Desulfuribacillus stibiiarsenatis]|uniref:Uncharacterized protein n=1 Tax=Desulfuribacillus stibiiarsenatis TaxID=1390249 RepID=A0A1E5L5D0_9FIRM|nr:hypothetical protein [Desulfuribacillus stibiiarsenatis]OEH85316.1 hypothetical protein BHU72_04265 [Desulfuribacillus stibiiarsenatis]